MFIWLSKNVLIARRNLRLPLMLDSLGNTALSAVPRRKRCGIINGKLSLKICLIELAKYKKDTFLFLIWLKGP